MATGLAIDLNCDMGEGFGAYTLGLDDEVMPLVTSANVACAFHASDPATMRRTVQLAKRHGVSVGAHPSFPDRVGFGRRYLAASPQEIRDDVTYQVGALWAFCRAEGVPLTHVKPHGALYNAAAKDLRIAEAIATAVRDVDRRLVLVCLAGSAHVDAAVAANLPLVREGFADRAYAADGTLSPRTAAGSVIHDPERMADRAVRMVRDRAAETLDGGEVALHVQTLCVHGDTPGALDALRSIRRRLELEQIAVRPFTRSSEAQ